MNSHIFPLKYDDLGHFLLKKTICTRCMAPYFSLWQCENLPQNETLLAREFAKRKDVNGECARTLSEQEVVKLKLYQNCISRGFSVSHFTYPLYFNMYILYTNTITFLSIHKRLKPVLLCSYIFLYILV